MASIYRPTDKGTTMPNAGDSEATRADAVDARLADAIAQDRNTEWSAAWTADRMTHTTQELVRVKDVEGCCNGLRCMHWVARPIAKVRGHGAEKPTGRVVSLADMLLVMRGNNAARPAGSTVPVKDTEAPSAARVLAPGASTMASVRDQTSPTA